MATPSILIVGTGSVGRRHAQNLKMLGAQVACFDPCADRLAQARQEIPEIVETYETLDAAVVHADRYTGVVIASPPRFHVEQAINFLQRGVPVLLEKPVSPDLAAAKQLQEVVTSTGTPFLLGYTYRWWPPFIELRHRLEQGVIGNLYNVRVVMSAHLADWHPWEPYQSFFMASRELGGGALLDESHFIDLMLWLFGMPDTLSGRAERLSTLEIDTDDNVDVLAVYPGTLRLSIHLDIYGRPHEKTITLVGENGTLQCLFDPNVLRFSTEAGGNWQSTPFPCVRNDMFVSVVREFLEVIEGRGTPTCTIEDGVRVLRCIEAIRLSMQHEKTIKVKEIC